MNQKTEAGFSYANLNNWRKLYLSIMWFISACLFLGGIAKFVQSPEQVDPMLIMIVSAILAFTYWTHVAVTKRKLKHLKLLALLNIVPFVNLIGALIMLSILRVSKNEHESLGLPLE